MIQTIAETIVWLAKEQMKEKEYQNLNSAILATLIEIRLYIINTYMMESKDAQQYSA